MASEKTLHDTHPKVLRIRAGLTLRALSQKTGIDAADLSRIERGVQQPRPSTQARIYDAIADTYSRRYSKEVSR